MIKRLLLFISVLACVGYETQAQAPCVGGLQVTITGSGTGLPLTFVSATVTTPIPCNGGTATVTLVVSGGTLPYTYSFNSQMNDHGVFTGVSAGTSLAYSITDANNCGPITGTIDVIQPTTLVASIGATDASGNPNDMIICPSGSADLTASASGGTGPYNYVWDPNIGSGAGPHTVSPGTTTTYTVTITDANSCVGTAEKTITVNPALSATIAETDNSGTADDMIICPGGSANLDANPSGGTAGYTYTWDNSLPSQETHTVSPASTTTYNVTVTDANGCQAFASKEITMNPALTATIAETDNSGTADDMIICPGGSANLDANPSGGTAGYTYTWDNSLPSQETHTVSPASTTTYNVTVTDANGCQAFASKEITVNPALTATIAETDNSGTADDMIICPGGSANLDANPSGGTAGYTYTWDNSLPSQETHTVSPASTTTYNVTVTDANGCQAFASKEITVNPALTATIAATDMSGYSDDMIICPGGSATLDANPNGGTPNYTYAWDGGPATETYMVSPGATTTYTVTVTDANGCIATAEKTITVNPAMSADITATDASGNPNDMIVCPGGSATLEANPSGGTPTGGGEYNYSWSHNPMPGNVKMVDVTPTSTTTYIVTVTDNVGCTVTASKEIIVNPAITITSATVTSNHNGAHVSCAVGQGTSNDGEITVAATGGTSPYMYSVDNGSNYQAGDVFAGLTAGTYTVVVKDANGCTMSTNVTIVAPTPITAATCTNANDLCQLSAGQVLVEASGGTGALNASWTSACAPGAGGPLAIPATFSGLTGGCTYNFKVTDANGCMTP